MSIGRQKQWMASASWDEVKRRWVNFGTDLGVFASLQIARFIVWRALRHGRRETTEQLHVFERVTENSAEVDHGQTFDSNQRNTEHEKPVADSMGHRHHDGLFLDNREA